MKVIIKILVCSIALLTLAARADNTLEKLQQKLYSITTYQANFRQIVKTKGRVIQRSKGTMAIQRPGKFRWYSFTPMKQLIVADGTKLWIFDKELEQVTVKPQKQGLGGTPALFLSGYDDSLSDDFDIVLTEKNNTSTFTLKPKSSSDNFKRIILYYNGKQLTRIKLYDKLDQLTDVKFSRIKLNQQLKAKLFKFKPPKGVDVIKDSGSA